MDNLNQRRGGGPFHKGEGSLGKGTTRFSRKSCNINASKGNAIPNQESHCP